MEVMLGYKATEIGAIPEEWDVKSFGDLFSFKNGVNADKGAYGKGVRFINVLEPIIYSHLFGPEIPGRVALPESILPSFEVKRGDILFNRTSETDSELGLAATFVGSERVVFGGFVIRGRPTDESFDPIYSGYALRARAIRDQIIPLGQGAVRANIGQSALSRVLAPVPPLAEQRLIADALHNVDELSSALEQLINKKRGLKQAVMQQLLTGRRRFPGFNQNWERRRLGEIGTFLKGRGIRKNEAQSGSIPCVRYGEIYTHHDDYIRTFNSSISPQVAETATRLRRGDLLFAGSGETKDEIGKCVAFIDNREAYAGGDIAILRSSRIDPIYMGYYCNTPFVNAQKSSKGQGDAVVHISAGALARIEVEVPSLAEQAAISEVLLDMDVELAALEQRREKTGALRQGMMQALLTGKTRLV